jgi:hypothetical protein
MQRSMTLASMAVSLMGLLSQARAQDPATNAGQTERSSKKLVAPASEHPGKPINIPEPEKGHSTAIGRPPESDVSPPASSRAAVVGTVVSVTRAPESVLIKDARSNEHQLMLTANTRFIRNRKAIRKRAIKRGDEVHVAYRQDADRLVAEQIELLQQPSARKKAQARQTH